MVGGRARGWVWWWVGGCGGWSDTTSKEEVGVRVLVREVGMGVRGRLGRKDERGELDERWRWGCECVCGGGGGGGEGGEAD